MRGPRQRSRVSRVDFCPSAVTPNPELLTAKGAKNAKRTKIQRLRGAFSWTDPDESVDRVSLQPLRLPIFFADFPFFAVRDPKSSRLLLARGAVRIADWSGRIRAGAVREPPRRRLHRSPGGRATSFDSKDVFDNDLLGRGNRAVRPDDVARFQRLWTKFPSPVKLPSWVDAPCPVPVARHQTTRLEPPRPVGD
jgi:hypothetical protein